MYFIKKIILFFCLNVCILFSAQNPTARIIVKTLNNPEPGYMFIGTNLTDMGLIDNYGLSIDSVAFSKIGGGFDLKLQKNGVITYFSSISGYFYALNNKYQIIDSFAVPSSLTTDFHDLTINSDGTYFMLAEEKRKVDMSKIITGGKTDAEVIGFTILEYDKNKNKTWQWSTWDHYVITDATPDNSLLESTIKYCHVNSIEKDFDGNILISSRHLDEVSKISKSTGNFIWRMGGNACKNNQFTFIGDTVSGFYGFSHQHDARRLANGNILLLDNGNLKNQQYSRVVEYRIDEINKTATKVWEFVPDPTYMAYAMGSCQRLPNGNTFISLSEFVYEVDKNNKLLFYGEIGDNASTYRTYKNVYNSSAISKNISASGTYNYTDLNNNTSTTLSISSISNSGRLSVEKHFYRPQKYLYTDFTPSKELNYRWVVSGEIPTLTATIKINTQDLVGFNLVDTFMIYQRDGENNGSFSKLNTSYVASTKTLEATIKKGGEFIVSNTKALPYIAPFLKSPLKESLFKGDSLLKWNVSIGAEKYKIQIDTNLKFNNPLIDTLTSLLNYNFFKFEKGTTYYWRVAGVNVSDNFNSPWSEIWNIKTPMSIPKLLEPLNASKNVSFNSGKLKWNKVKSANSYLLDLSKDINFTNKIINALNVTDTSYLFQELNPYTNYFWQVSAVNGNEITKHSTTFSFITTLPVPKLNYPLNKSVGISNSDVLEFEKFLVGNYYQYHLSKSIDFKIVEFEKTISISQEAKFTNLSSLTRYFWKVRCITKSDTSAWSEIFQFTTGIPTPKLYLPYNHSTNEFLNCNLKWTKTEGNKNCEANLSEDNLFSNSKQYLSDSNQIIANNLKPNKKYYWKVRAKSDGGDGIWSDTWDFTTALSSTLTIPELIYPLDHSKDIETNLKFKWKVLTNINSYRIQVALDSNYDNIINNSNINSNEFNISNLDSNTVYYWRVQSQNIDAVSQWSETRSFITSTSNFVSAPILFIPQNNVTLSTTKVNFKWAKIKNAISYDLKVADDILLSQNTINIPDLIDTTYIQILENNKTFYWSVIAKNKFSNSSISQVFSFKIDEKSLVEDFEKSNIKISKLGSILNIETQDNFNINLSIFDLNGKELDFAIINYSSNSKQIQLPNERIMFLKINYLNKSYLYKIVNIN